MTVALTSVIGMAIVAGFAVVLTCMERNRRKARERAFEREREAWRDGGFVGPEPVRDSGRHGTGASDFGSGFGHPPGG